jgi:glycosyltransferase involved in cell wall biosynthesis
MATSLFSKEWSDPEADVLVITNMWPHDDNPAYGIFVQRQVRSLIDAGVRCDVMFVRGYRSPRAYGDAAVAVAGLNRRPRYRLVHAHGGETAVAARTYVRGPVLVSYCGDDLLGTPLADGRLTRQSRVRRQLLRQHSRLLPATITKSSEMEATLPRPERNTVVPNGVDTNVFAPLDRAEARRRLGWPADARIALFAADPKVERKRHWLAAAACEEASRAVGAVDLRVATALDPADMPTWMSAADCLVLTSAIEGSPNVVKEALMCDLPVVSTDVGDVRELLTPVADSHVCAADPRELGAAIARVVDPPRRSNGRSVSGHLTQEAIAARVLAIYESLVPGLAPTRGEPMTTCAA